MVKSLAGSPSTLPLLSGGNRHEDEVGQSILDLDVEASGAASGYILDASGAVVASSNGSDASPGSPGHRSSPLFVGSMIRCAGLSVRIQRQYGRARLSGESADPRWRRGDRGRRGTD